MNVLSLFDGMSCGQLALRRAGIEYNKYYASEIDKHAIKVARANFPETIHLGGVENVTASELPSIDLLIGGSPCQSFSSTGDGTGFEGKSGLFWHYARLLRELKAANPNVLFLLENVVMRKEWRDIITRELGVEPIAINSALVSAQNRSRLYWTNIPCNSLPVDRGVVLPDVLMPIVPDKYFLSDKAIAYINREDRIRKRMTAINGEKSICLQAYYDNSKNGTFLCVDANGRIDADKTGSITQRYGKGVENYGSNPFLCNGHRFRKLTPIECERLQTVPDDYTAAASDTQRYRMIGNGWTVDVIAHLFKGLK